MSIDGSILGNVPSTTVIRAATAPSLDVPIVVPAFGWSGDQRIDDILWDFAIMIVRVAQLDQHVLLRCVITYAVHEAAFRPGTNECVQRHACWFTIFDAGRFCFRVRGGAYRDKQKRPNRVGRDTIKRFARYGYSQHENFTDKENLITVVRSVMITGSTRERTKGLRQWQ